MVSVCILSGVLRRATLLFYSVFFFNHVAHQFVFFIMSKSLPYCYRVKCQLYIVKISK